MTRTPETRNCRDSHGQLTPRVTEVLTHPEPGWMSINGVDPHSSDGDERGSPRPAGRRAHALTRRPARHRRLIPGGAGKERNLMGHQHDWAATAGAAA